VNVLVVAPHPDDESIGCGGTLRLHVQRGDRVDVVFLTSGELGLEELPADDARQVREREAEQAAAILGLSSLTFLRHPDWFLSDTEETVGKDLIRVVEQRAPERVLFPHGAEAHPDHAATARIVDRVADELRRPFGRVAFEVWTPMIDFDDVEDISGVIDAKLAAVRAYKSQLSKFRYDDAVEGLNRFRGALAAHCAHAEAFRLFDD
jgi:LmbE family N-acetylglucosaminyl deacetylase